MARRDLIVVGASAGGVESLRRLVRGLPEDLPACILVVLHLPGSAYSALPSILDRAGPLPARTATDGSELTPGQVLVAPPDHHLVVREDRVALIRGPRENGHRPAVDVLFRSAARWRGPRTIGVVLSGALDDGAAGLLKIVERGGAAVVLDPDVAMYDGMPRAALCAVPEAICASENDLPRILTKLSSEEVPDHDVSAGRTLEMETDVAAMDEDALAEPDRPGVPAAMTCPDCNGAMFELDDGAVVRYRCRVGHAWSPESLLMRQVEAAEGAIWAAIRVLEEKSALHRTLAQRTKARGQVHAYQEHVERAEDAQSSAGVLRELLRQPLPGAAHEVSTDGEPAVETP